MIVQLFLDINQFATSSTNHIHFFYLFCSFSQLPSYLHTIFIGQLDIRFSTVSWRATSHFSFHTKCLARLRGFFPSPLCSSVWGYRAAAICFWLPAKHPKLTQVWTMLWHVPPLNSWSSEILHLDIGISWGAYTCALGVGIVATYSHSFCVFCSDHFLSSDAPLPPHAGLLLGAPELCGSDRTQVIMGSSRCVVLWFCMVKHSAMARAQKHSRSCFTKDIPFSAADGAALFQNLSMAVLPLEFPTSSTWHPSPPPPLTVLKP